MSQYDDDNWPGEEGGGDRHITSDTKCCEGESRGDLSQRQCSSMNATNIEKLCTSALEKASLVRDAAYNVREPECLKEAVKALNKYIAPF